MTRIHSDIFRAIVGSIILCLCIHACGAVDFAGGTGEPNDPYQIATAEQLISIGSDPDLLASHFVLIADIDLDPNLSEDYVFNRSPIDGKFSGIFDGQGCCIRNLTIVGIVEDGTYEELALFKGTGNGGKVRRLTLDDVCISSNARGGAIAGLCGSNGGVISKCSVSGTISSADAAGGLVAWNAGLVEECGSICDVSGKYSGGLIAIDKGQVQDCYASGRVSGTRTGGLVAGVGTIERCYATCQVVNTGTYSGGLAGYEYRQWSWVADSYFLAPSDGGGPDNGFGMPLTMEQMREPASFAGWDFWGIGNDGFRIPWFMSEDGYPELAWLALSAIPKVRGLSADEASQAIEKAGITIGGLGCDYDHTVEYGGAIAAHPHPGARPGTSVDLILSLGLYDWSANPGRGDAESPYLIVSAGQLDCLGHQPELWDRCFKLGSDIDLKWRTYCGSVVGKSDWTGILFQGTFDGNGHLIKNLTIEGHGTSANGHQLLGFFGQIGESGCVKDLGLTDVLIQGREYWDEVGGMLCAINGGCIERCYCAGVLQGYGKLGGLVGSNTGVVEDCYAQGEVEDLSETDGDGHYAGLVADNSTGTIRTCYATCSILSYYAASGLVGCNEGGSITHSLWDVEASGVDNSDGGTGLQTSELMDPETPAYYGWGGNPNWIVEEGKDYPRLIWEGTPGTSIPETPRR